jgi:hypothetical protein
VGVSALFSRPETSESIREAYHSGRYDKIVTIFSKVGVSARKIYLENLKHEDPDEDDPPLNAEQKAYNKTLDDQIKSVKAFAEYMAAPEGLVENFKTLDKAWKAGQPKAVLKALMDMGLDTATVALKLLKQSAPTEVDESTLTAEQRQEREAAEAARVAHNKQLDELLSLVEDTERVVHIVDELDSVAAGWAQYKQTSDPNVLTAALQKFGKEAFSAHVAHQKHPAPEAPAKLTEQQKKENKELDQLLLKYTGVASVLQGGVQVASGRSLGDTDEVTRGAGRILSGGLDLAASQDVDTGESQLALSLGSSSMQTMLAIAAGRDTDAIKGFEEVLKASDKVKDTVLDQLKTDENNKRVEEVAETELLEAALKEKIQTALKLPTPSAEFLQEKLDELDKMEASGIAARVDAERSAFRDELEQSIGGLDPEQDPRTRLAIVASFDIDTLIAKLERDKLILDTAVQLANTISATGAGLVPGLRTVSAVKELMVSVSEAMVRRAEYYKFLDSLKTAEVSMSPYAPAIQQFVDTAQQRYDDADLKSVVNLFNVYASTFGGVFGAVGQACVTLTGSDKATERYTDAEKRDAWKIYQAALNAPEDRKLKIRALQLNPTLGKYALAYGAQSGDPIARSFMRCCGLNEQTLASKEANVGKVVTYLGLYFNDEIVTTGMALPQEWARQHDIAMTAASWTSLTRKAQKSAALKAGGDEQVVRAMLEAEQHPYLSASSPAQHETQYYIKVLKHIQWALDNYAPVNTSAQPHTDMLQIATRYRAMAARHQALAEVAL